MIPDNKCIITSKYNYNLSNNYIPKNIIQTYKHNYININIYNNIQNVLKKNSKYNYIFITDMDAYVLIKNNFNQNTLEAFNKINIGACKGDFIRYCALYIYGGIYMDMDGSIEISLDDFIEPDKKFIFFYDYNFNMHQYCLITQKNNIIFKYVIDEMVKRINNNELNIFIATGPTLFTDVIYNLINKTNIYNTNINVDSNDRKQCFINNKYFMNGLILSEDDINNKFLFNMTNYNNNLLYENNDKYEVTYNKPTPNLYK